MSARAIKLSGRTLRELRSLKSDERERVLNWIASKLGVNLARPKSKHEKRDNAGGSEDRIADLADNGDSGQETFADFADLCIAANPSTDAERALVAGYWFQVCQDEANFGSQECNTQLKHYGTPLGNVTRAFDYLQAANPKLAVQLRKSGSSKQARKTYKITHQGIQRVKEMISG